MAASDEVDVVLNPKQYSQRNGEGGGGGMVKLGNTEVNRGSKNVSLRHLFNGLS